MHTQLQRKLTPAMVARLYATSKAHHNRAEPYAPVMTTTKNQVLDIISRITQKPGQVYHAYDVLVVESKFYQDKPPPTPEELLAIIGQPLVWPPAPLHLTAATQSETVVLEHERIAKLAASVWPELAVLFLDKSKNRHLTLNVLTLALMGERLVRREELKEENERSMDLFNAAHDIIDLASEWLLA